MKNTLVILIIIVFLAAGGYLAYSAWQNDQAAQITTYADCAAAGYPILESYPPRCLTPDGRTLTDDTATTTALTLNNGTYTIGTSTSKIVWEGRKKLISNYVDRGTIKVKSGEVKVANGRLESANLVIDMNSIVVDTTSKVDGDKSKLVSHLKSDDFFGVTTYPTATFTLRTATPSAQDINKYNLEGDLTIRDKTAMVIIPATLSTTNGQLLIKGETMIDRTKFDVKFGSTSFFKELADDKIIEDEFKLVFSLIAELK